MTGNIRVSPSASMKRVIRHPQHTFQLRTRPWQIAPFMIAPVLPGETMKTAMLQSRVVTDPIKNPLIGWWKEYMLFYVKHRDLYDRDKLSQMVLNPEVDLSSLDSATAVEYYHTNGTELAINWPLLCMERVVDEYFRYEGEDISTASIGNLPAASIQNSSWIDSLDLASNIETPADENLASAVAGQGDGTTAVLTSEIDAAMRRYEIMKFHGLTDMTYEDYLSTYGVKPKAEELHRPELIRHWKEWSYPTNTIDPTNGTPRSAVSWVVSGRADKDRFFREPGFIFGVTITRPKVYLKNLDSNAVMMMKDALTWLPALMSADPYASIRQMTSGDPPFDNASGAYVVDIKDLLLYGDQFVNFALSATDANLVDLPSAAALRRYASGTDADALFVSASPANQIREDGIVSLSIAGRQTDTTPNSIGTNITV